MLYNITLNEREIGIIKIMLELSQGKYGYINYDIDMALASIIAQL